MPLYRKELLGDTEEGVLKYTSSIEEDAEFVEEVVEVLKAHVRELVRGGYVETSVGNEIIEVLNEVLKDPSKVLRSEFEDVHEGIEAYLRERLGERAGYLALGRSRNDHVATALRLKVIREVKSILNLIREVRKELLNAALNYVNTPIPLFTHEQPAQVGTATYYLLYIDDILRTHYRVLKLVTEVVVKQSPLGCGAIAGTNVCLDRDVLAKELGFNELAENCLYATSTRDFIFLIASVITSLANELSRVFNDLIAWSSPNFSIVSVGSKHLSTSSLMPHKKNPVTLEVLRSWAGESLGELISVATIVKGLHSGYNLDLQEVNKHCFRILRLAKDSLVILKDLISNLSFNDCSKDLSYYLVATDIAELIAIKAKVPFREVHKLVAKCFKLSSSEGEFIKCVCLGTKELVGSNAEELCRDLSEVIKNPIKSIELKCVKGSINPKLINELIRERLKEVNQ